MSIYGRRHSSCAECGKAADGKEFCGAKCRSAWHNRRTKRGALLYDLAMIELVDRDSFNKYNMGGRRDQQIAAWHAEDEAAGRKRTWARPTTVTYSLPIGEVLRKASG